MTAPGRTGLPWALPAVGLALLLLVAGPWAPAAAQPAPLPEPVIEGPVASAPDPPEVDAAAWMLMDAGTGQVLAEHRADQRRPVASTIKVLTALTVVERAEPDEIVEVGDEVNVGGASVGLRPGDRWRVEELLDALVARSGNDAAEALAAHVAGDMTAFVDLMREDAAALGLDDLVLTGASGLDDGNQVSARDLATIARVALRDERLRPVFARSIVDLPRRGQVATRNELLEAYPGATGMKTGYTSAAGFSLVASAERDGRELLAVVLDAGEDPARFQAAMALLDHGFDDFAATRLEVDWRLLVAGGDRPLRLGPVPVVLPEGADVGWEGLPPTAVAPVASDRVALEVDDRPVADLEVELGPGPEAVEGGSRLGRVLVDQAHAGMRAAIAHEAW